MLSCFSRVSCRRFRPLENPASHFSVSRILFELKERKEGRDGKRMDGRKKGRENLWKEKEKSKQKELN